MSVELKPHNQEGYNNVVEMYKTQNRAAIIHPTGTGKSYIAIKLIEDNPDKKVLFLSSSNPILHQLKENIIAAEGKMFSNLNRMTYQKVSRLSDEDIDELSPEIIVLDEFHHCGAEVWGAAVQYLIDKYPNAKILGLSATPIRYFDGNVDMAEKLFADAIASEISFEESLERNILPKFDYVSALYGYEDSLRNLQERIEEQTGKVAASKTDAARSLFNNLRTALDSNVDFILDVLAKHMTKDGKYIVYCKDIEDMNKKVAEAHILFSKVNSNMNIYKVSSAPDDIRENEKTLTEFENDSSPDALKLMFSVNMLNEGYHVPDVDGVIMMRPTQSPTIYQQQMGRALTVGNTNGKRPVIIDLVDNFDSIRIIEDFAERMKQYQGVSKQDKQTKPEAADKVAIFDYIKDIDDIIKKIEKLSRMQSLSFDEKLQLFEKFYADPNTDDNLRGDTIYEGYPIGNYYIQMRHEINTGKGNYTEEQIAKLTELGYLDTKQMKIEDRAKRLAAFCKEYPSVWKAGNRRENYISQNINVEEQEEVRKRLQEADEDYAYISHRNWQGKLSSELFSYLKDAGVGRCFGARTDIDEIVRQYSMNADGSVNEQFRAFLIQDTSKCNNMDEYRSQYIDLLINNPKLIRAKYAGGYFVCGFDFEQPDFVDRDCGFYRRVLKKMGLDDSIFFISKELKNAIDEAVSCLTPREKDVLERRYGKDGRPRRLEEVGRSYMVTRERIRLYEAKACRKLNNSSRKWPVEKELDLCQIDAESKEKFVREYFKHHDIFFEQNVRELPPEVQEKLRDIFECGRDKIRESHDEKEVKVFSSQNDDSNAKRIEDLDFSVRTFSCLKRAGVNTLDDIGDLSHDALLKVRNLGRKGYDEVVEKMESLGLKFADEKETMEENIKPNEGVKQAEETEETTQQGECAQLEEMEPSDEVAPEEVSNSKNAELENYISQLKASYDRRIKEKEDNQAAQTQLKQEIERIITEKSLSIKTVEKLEDIMKGNEDFLVEIGELQTLKRKISMEKEKIAQKEKEEKQARDKLKKTEAEEKKIDADIQKIKEKGHDFSK